MDPENEIPAPEEYDLKLSGPGLTIERQIDQDEALQIVAILMGGAGIPRSQPGVGRPVPAMTSPAAARAGARLSLREFLDSVEAKRNPDKILAIGRYLLDQRGDETFGSDDVKKQFRAAGEPVPANFGRDFRWTITNAWIAEVHEEKGQYYVTESGNHALEQKFSPDVKKRTGVERGRRRRKRAGSNDKSE